MRRKFGERKAYVLFQTGFIGGFFLAQEQFNQANLEAQGASRSHLACCSKTKTDSPLSTNVGSSCQDEVMLPKLRSHVVNPQKAALDLFSNPNS